MGSKLKDKLKRLKKQKGKAKPKAKTKVSKNVYMMRLLKKRCEVKGRTSYVFKKDGTIKLETPLVFRRKSKNQRIDWRTVGGQYEIAANLLLTVTDPHMAKSLSGRFVTQVLTPLIRDERGSLKGKTFILKQETINNWIAKQEDDMKYMRGERKILQLSNEA